MLRTETGLENGQYYCPVETSPGIPRGHGGNELENAIFCEYKQTGWSLVKSLDHERDVCLLILLIGVALSIQRVHSCRYMLQSIADILPSLAALRSQLA